VDATQAIIMVDNSTETIPASYEGLALGQNSHGQNVLYAADGSLSLDASNNRFDMFDGSFHSLGSFTDPTVASQYPGYRSSSLGFRPVQQRPVDRQCGGRADQRFRP
jgi:hypothetical protein